MGQRNEFGYLATPKSGRGPAIIVIQEWWGLVRHIEDVCDRFADEGFLACAPDLFHGKTTKSPDEAGKMVMELDAERAANEIAAAGADLLTHPECSSKKYGIVGFCMGGGLAKFVATRDANVGAAVSFYGGFKKVDANWNNLQAPMILIAGEKDKGLAASEPALAEKLQEMGKDVTFKLYPNVDHAFFNDTRPEVYNAEAATDAWRMTLDFFRANVGRT
jgi:carboxymethylenebutenolidase